MKDTVLEYLKFLFRQPIGCFPQALWTQTTDDRGDLLWGNDCRGEMFCFDPTSRVVEKFAFYFTNVDCHGTNAFGFDREGRLQCLDLQTRKLDRLPVIGGGDTLAVSPDKERQKCHAHTSQSLLDSTSIKTDADCN